MIVNNYRIRRLDEHNMVLEELLDVKKKDGKKAVKWKLRGYYSTTRHALRALRDRLSGDLISGGDVTLESLDTITTLINSIEGEV
jgi:hypothetical protein